MALTGRVPLLALLAVLPVALSGSLWTVAAIGVLLAAVVAGDVALAAPVGALRLSRAGSTSCRLGESATVQLTIGNPSRRPLRGRLRDAWVPSAGASPAEHAVEVPAGERRELTTVLHPTRRGDRRPSRVTVRSIGPLGCAGRQGAHVVPWQVRVAPSFPSRKYLPSRLARLRSLDGQTSARVRGSGTEFDALRDFVDGDDVRSIDWRATARRSDLVVRTWRPERDRRILMVLDTSRTSAGRVGDVPRLDAALDAALLLTALATRAGDSVDLLALDRQLRAVVQDAGRTEVLARMVDALSGLEPVLVEGDGRGLVTEVLRRARRRSLLVLFTSLDRPALEEGLLPALPALTSRHTVVLAAVSDPRIDQMQRGRGHLGAVYDAAAAAAYRRERGHVAALLRRRGVDVVDAPPESFAPAVADRYLDLKAAGRL